MTDEDILLSAKVIRKADEKEVSTFLLRIDEDVEHGESSSARFNNSTKTLTEETYQADIDDDDEWRKMGHDTFTRKPIPDLKRLLTLNPSFAEKYFGENARSKFFSRYKFLSNRRPKYIDPSNGTSANVQPVVFLDEEWKEAFDFPFAPKRKEHDFIPKRHRSLDGKLDINVDESNHSHENSNMELTTEEIENMKKDLLEFNCQQSIGTHVQTSRTLGTLQENSLFHLTSNENNSLHSQTLSETSSQKRPQSESGLRRMGYNSSVLKRLQNSDDVTMTTQDTLNLGSSAELYTDLNACAPISPRSKYIENCIVQKVNPRASLLLRKNLTKDLRLQHQRIGDKMASLLAESLQDLSFVELLDISDNCLTDSGLTAILNAITNIPTITHLNLSDNSLGFNAAKALSNYLLHSDEPRANQMMLASSTTTVGSVSTSTTPTPLHVKNSVSSRIINRNQCQIRTLILNNNNIHDKEFDIFIQAMKNSKLLKTLDVANNHLGEDEALTIINADTPYTTAGANLADLLRSPNCVLEVLNLKWNKIRHYGGFEIARSLAVNTHLLHIDLSYNSIGRDAGIALGDAIISNNTLQKLLISHNNIDDVACLTICVGVQLNKSIKYLELDGNPIGELGSLALVLVPLKCGNRIKISAINCNISIKSQNTWVNINNICGNYNLNLSNAFERALCLMLLDLVAYHPTYTFSKIQHVISTTNHVKKHNMDLIQIPLNLKYFDEAQLQHKASLEQIIKASFDDSLARSIFQQIDRNNQGTVELEKLSKTTDALDLTVDNLSLKYLLHLMGSDLGHHEVRVTLEDFMNLLHLHKIGAAVRLSDLVRTPAMALKASPDAPYMPPKVGTISFSVIDSFVVKPIFRVVTVADCVYLNEVAGSSRDTSTLLCTAVKQVKLRVNEALLLYHRMMKENVSNKIKFIATIIPQLIHPLEAQLFLQRTTNDDRIEVNRVKKALRFAYGPLLGVPVGYYNLDLSNEMDRLCLSRLLEQSVKFYRRTVIAATAVKVGHSGGIHLGDISQKGNHTAFRNEWFNGAHIQITADLFTPMPTSGRLDFDFSGHEEPPPGRIVISDSRCLKILKNTLLLPSDKEASAFLKLKFWKDEEQRCHAGVGRPIYECPSEKAKAVGGALHRLTELCHSRSRHYETAIGREEIVTDWKTLYRHQRAARRKASVIMGHKRSGARKSSVPKSLAPGLDAYSEASEESDVSMLGPLRQRKKSTVQQDVSSGNPVATGANPRASISRRRASNTEMPSLARKGSTVEDPGNLTTSGGLGNGNTNRPTAGLSVNIGTGVGKRKASVKTSLLGVDDSQGSGNSSILVQRQGSTSVTRRRRSTAGRDHSKDTAESSQSEPEVDIDEDSEEWGSLSSFGEDPDSSAGEEDMDASFGKSGPLSPSSRSGNTGPYPLMKSASGLNDAEAISQTILAVGPAMYNQSQAHTIELASAKDPSQSQSAEESSKGSPTNTTTTTTNTSTKSPEPKVNGRVVRNSFREVLDMAKASLASSAVAAGKRDTRRVRREGVMVNTDQSLIPRPEASQYGVKSLADAAKDALNDASEAEIGWVSPVKLGLGRANLLPYVQMSRRQPTIQAAEPTLKRNPTLISAIAAADHAQKTSMKKARKLYSMLQQVDYYMGDVGAISSACSMMNPFQSLKETKAKLNRIRMQEELLHKTIREHGRLIQQVELLLHARRLSLHTTPDPREDKNRFDVVRQDYLRKSLGESHGHGDDEPSQRSHSGVHRLAEGGDMFAFIKPRTLGDILHDRHHVGAETKSHDSESQRTRLNTVKSMRTAEEEEESKAKLSSEYHRRLRELKAGMEKLSEQELRHIEFAKRYKLIVDSEVISQQAKASRIAEYIIEVLSRIWIRCRHLALILHQFRRLGCVDKVPHFGTYRVEIVVGIFSRLVDKSNFEIVLGELNAEENAAVFFRLGWLNIFNPLKPEGSWEFDLSVFEQRQIAKILIALQAMETGENWADRQFRWDRDDTDIPGWKLVQSWLSDKGVPHRGILFIRYFAGDGIGTNGAHPNVPFRLALLKMVSLSSADLVDEDAEINIPLYLQKHSHRLKEAFLANVAASLPVARAEAYAPFLPREQTDGIVATIPAKLIHLFKETHPHPDNSRGSGPPRTTGGIDGRPATSGARLMTSSNPMTRMNSKTFDRGGEAPANVGTLGLGLMTRKSSTRDFGVKRQVTLNTKELTDLLSTASRPSSPRPPSGLDGGNSVTSHGSSGKKVSVLNAVLKRNNSGVNNINRSSSSTTQTPELKPSLMRGNTGTNLGSPSSDRKIMSTAASLSTNSSVSTEEDNGSGIVFPGKHRKGVATTSSTPDLEKGKVSEYTSGNNSGVIPGEQKGVSVIRPGSSKNVTIDAAAAAAVTASGVKKGDLALDLWKKLLLPKSDPKGQHQLRVYDFLKPNAKKKKKLGGASSRKSRSKLL